MEQSSCNDPTHAGLLAAVERLVAENRRLAELIDAQAAQILMLLKTVEKQAKRIAVLEERLGRNSRNSSRPPSSDSPYKKQKRTAKPPDRKQGRKQGGQPGHRGSGRALLDVSAVHGVVPHFPETCSGCGHGLPEVPDSDPLREQICEILNPDRFFDRRSPRRDRRICPGSVFRVATTAVVADARATLSDRLDQHRSRW